uniref:B-cell receptor CD22 n=1 Tax=Salmo trutta TaxID=8032 RepID=A0A674A4E9_SALTR
MEIWLRCVIWYFFLSGKNCWSVTYTHQSICTLKGSTVDISCSYTYPSYYEIKKAFWFTKWSGMDAEDLSSVPGYEGHIEYLGDKESDCTLRITDLRLSDSAGYMFRFITSGGTFSGSPVSLTVTDVVLEMNRRSVSEGERVTLTCRTKCTLDSITAYSWYKNGQPIPNSNTYSPVYSLFSVSSEDTGRYSCAVEGLEDLPSAEETLTVTCKYMGFKPLACYISIVVTDITVMPTHLSRVVPGGSGRMEVTIRVSSIRTQDHIIPSIKSNRLTLESTTVRPRMRWGQTGLEP